MKILDDLISSLSEDSVVREVHTCALWTAALSRGCGLAATFHITHPLHGMVREAGNLRGKSALELAEYTKSANLLEASTGMAAINSLVDIDESKFIMENTLDILLREGQGKNIAIVGHFPWIPQLRRVVKKLWVIEQRSREGDLPAEVTDEILPPGGCGRNHRHRVHQSHRGKAAGVEPKQFCHHDWTDQPIVTGAV